MACWSKPRREDRVEGRESTDERRRIVQAAGDVGAAAFALAMAACSGGSGGGAGTGPLRVTCTIGMIADAASTIAGDHATVVGLMGPGVDPHLYKASEGDLEKLGNAQLILYNGLNLE